MLQDLCLVLLISVVFTNPLALTSSYDVHPKQILQFETVPSQNRSSPLTVTSVGPRIAKTSSNGGEVVEHHAVFRSRSTPESGYSGGMATLDVYRFPDLENGVATAAIIWVSNYQNGDLSDLNEIQAGWVVDPSLYADSETHFFVYWKVGGNQPAGCFNLDCEGFVPVNGAPISPGDILQLDNGQPKISLKIFKSKDDGDWWLHFGYDIHNLNRVGYWPKSLFTNLMDHARSIGWGGYAASPKGYSSPPMGNGQWPGKESASVRNVQYVDTNGQPYAPPPWPAGLEVFVSNKKCYQASIFVDDMFYYGGPGGCIN